MGCSYWRVRLNTNVKIIYFDLFSSKIHTLIGHTAEVSSAQFNWDCSRIVTGSMDKTCKLWDTLSGTKRN
jgi:dynein assembly factor with WDR repeat domains 1